MSELAKEKNDNYDKNNKIFYYKINAERYRDITKGLSPQNIEKLKWTAKKLHEQELEERRQREQVRRRERSQGRGGR